jgi:uncharacterized zinc-type alcohol dehydrogenase-like protein
VTRVQAFAAPAPRAALQPFSYDAAPLGPEDVEIEITHCGVCHSDIHLIDDDWNRSKYPFVPGHEIAGRISAVGREVRHLAVGQRAGAGWQRSACMRCALCRTRQENLCAAQQATCVGHHGGLAERIRTDGRFVFPIPDALESAGAAPLLCGGVTVYAPLRRYRADATRHVGVVGIGGLGHLALRFAAAFGCEVTAFSSSLDKRTEVLQMGAHHFVHATDVRQVRARVHTLDLLISTVAARLDWITYLETLRPNGVLCLVGAPPGVLQIPAVQLVAGQRAICGSDIGDPATISEMLEVAARHRILPTVEVDEMGNVNAGIARLRENRVRYRLVLQNR